MPSLIDQAKKLVERRLAEIQEEKDRLGRALIEFNGSQPSKPRGRRAGRPSPRKSSGGRARHGERAEQFVELVTKNPDMRGSEIARTLGMRPSQAYQLGSRLEKQGRVEKTKNGYRPKA